MSEAPFEILVEQDGANDRSFRVVKIYVEAGVFVSADEHLFDLESSKVLLELRAPQEGVLVHDLHVGDVLRVEAVVARLFSREVFTTELLPVASSQEGRVDSNKAMLPEAFFSRDATVLAQKHGLSAKEFSAQFVSKAAVLTRLDLGQPAVPGKQDKSAVKPSVKAASLGVLSQHKQAEIEVISNGPGASMLSVVGRTLTSYGIVRPNAGFFADKIIDIVLFEASRLMERFKKLNSAFQDGHIHYHDGIVGGVAFDGGGRLVVYGIEQSASLTLEEVQKCILDGLSKYVENKLSLPELSNATFTITDLSTEGAEFLFPLLPRGQSCIIGICRALSGGFKLYLGFDHRVTEGREVALFLEELCSRIRRSIDMYAKHELRCEMCDTAVGDGDPVVRALIKAVDSRGNSRLCCFSCLS